MTKVLCGAAVAAAWGACAIAAHAQALTAAEIAARFREQIESINAARVNPTLGATRGLVLTNVAPDEDPGGAATIAPAPVPLASEPAATEGAETAASQTHWTLPKNEQVNVQVTFSFDSAALSASQKPKLEQVCGAIDAAGVGVLRIVGHTDASGPWSYNQQLSELRAEEVKRFFVNDCGVAEDRLQAVGVGEQFPYDEKNPGAGVNRRVEFQAIS